MLPHKPRLIRLAAVLVLTVLEISCSSAPSDLRSMMPGDALVYLESNDLYRAMEPIAENQQFENASASKPDLSALKGIQLAAAVTGFEVREDPLNDENSVGKVQPKFVAVADTHAWSWQARAFAENQLGEFINKAYGGGINLETADNAEGRKYVWTAEDGRKAFALVSGSLVFFANDEGALDRSLATRRGEGDSMAKNPQLPQAAADMLAMGYISPEGIQQMSNLVGMSVAMGAGEDDEVKSFVARVLPEILRNSVKEVSWVSTLSDGKYADKYSISLAPDLSKVFSETLSGTKDGHPDLSRFIPPDAVSATRYNFEKPQIAWRSVLLSAQSKTDQTSGKLIGAFSSSLFEPYAIEDPELFLSSVESGLQTVRRDAEGENVVAIAKVRDADGVRRAAAKEINFTKPAEKVGNADVWRSADGDYAAAFTDGYVLLGDAESVLKCLQGGSDATLPAGAVETIGKDSDPSATLAEVLGERKGENTPLVQNYSVATYFTQNGIERVTRSDLGLIGAIVAQVGDEK